MRIRAFCSVLLVLAVVSGPSLPQSVGAAVGGPSPVAVGQARLSNALARDLATLPAETTYGFFAHFRGGTPTDWRATLEGAGFGVLSVYESVDAAFAHGAIGDLRALSHDPLVSFLQDNRAISLLDETAPWATRVRVAQEAVASGPYRDTAGRILDGSGVGVAIVDSGADSGHPDLVNRIVTDYKVECSFVLVYSANDRCFPDPIPLPKGVPSDTTSGHGTHVAGIVAGDGTASRGLFKGAAPGASLFTFGVGEGRNVFFAAQAYDFIVGEYASFTPRIRVINNSWGDPEGSLYDPEDIISKLVRAAGELGVTSVFAAGNDGDADSTTADNGEDDDLSSTAKDPTPGVISVANYYDNQTGTRDHTLSDSSSRGRKGDAVNYPDISAPGQFITSTCTFRLPLCATGLLPETRWLPHYNHLTGTSMAAPHVAGVAALLYQARPDLTPAQVEDVLQDTAYKFTGGVTAPGAYEADPQNVGSTIAFDKGAGIVDVPAALDALGVAHDRLRPPAPPAINLTEPAEGADADGPTVVRGTAFDGTPPPATLETFQIATGDGGDFAGPKAADIVAVSATEQAGGMSYAIQVANLADLPLTGTTSLRLFQRLNTVNRTSEVTLRSTGVTIPAASATHNAAPTLAARDLATNTVRMFVPFANLGDPAAGSIATELWAASYVGVFTDAAPGRLAAEGVAQPERGRPYSIVRPAPITPPTTVGVLVSVDGGIPAFTTMGGASPTWTWAGAVDLTNVAGGVHRIDAVLQVNGVDAARDTVTVTVPTLIYDIEIATPADGDVVLLAPTTVAGTATATRTTAAAQSVTVQVQGAGYDSGPRLVAGVASWSQVVDFGLLRPGPYTVTARQYADGIVVDTDTVSVTVPSPTPGDQISYAPQGAGWWKQQLAGGARFTAEEISRIKGRAVQLSNGWFESSDALTAAVTASGRQSAEARASRQFGVLALNLSAGDLSRTMTSAVGLSGAERLSPAVYAPVVGADVDAAAAWVRAQLPSGDLAGATAVATSINGGIGLE